MDNALSSSLSELPEGPTWLSTELMKECRSGRGTCTHWALQNVLYLALPVFCLPSRSCFFTARKLGNCKDFTEMAPEGHFEEKFCFLWHWFSVRISQLGACGFVENFPSASWRCSGNPWTCRLSRQCEGVRDLLCEGEFPCAFAGCT